MKILALAIIILALIVFSYVLTVGVTWLTIAVLGELGYKITGSAWLWGFVVWIVLWIIKSLTK